MFELQTDRLRIRPLKKSDVSNVMKIFSDPVAMEHYPSTKSIQEAEEWIDWTHNNYNAYNVGMWAVELIDTCEFVGQCGIVPQKINGEVLMEIGYLFARDYWGKGYATEAAKACLKYGFEKCKYPKLISLIAPENKPSAAVASKIGMHKETTIIKWKRPIDVYTTNSDKRV